jgi:Zn-dependent protease
MRDPFSWSFPVGRLFGIAIRVHILFPVVAVALVLRVATLKTAIPGTWVDAAMVVGLLFFSVLLHEFGHCFGARLVEGEANEILLWPLGGLASVDIPHRPGAHFITALMGPVVNLVICAVCIMLLLVVVDPPLQPLWNPFTYIYRHDLIRLPGGDLVPYMKLTGWDGKPHIITGLGALVLTRLFWVNWVLFLLNVCLLAYPLDGGRLLQAGLWTKWGYRQAMFTAVVVGFFFMFAVGIYALADNDVFPLCLAIIIFAACRQQWLALESGGEESLFGYDFSQGYTSLERDQPPAPRKRRPNFWQRWLQRRAARKLQREQETREAEEKRMDELLEKIQREGRQSLTDEENRFLKRVADKYRNRQ